MDESQFNVELSRAIESLSYWPGMPFRYRTGLADGYWYTIAEIADALSISQSQCVEYIEKAGKLVCDSLAASVPVIESDTQRQLSPSLHNALLEATRKINEEDLTPRTQDDLQAERYSSFVVLGNATVPAAVLLAVKGKGGAVSDEELFLVQQTRVAWLRDIVVVMLRNREEEGTYRGGNHLALFSTLCSLENGEPQFSFVDVDLINADEVAGWIRKNDLDRRPSSQFPWLFRPFSTSE